MHVSTHPRVSLILSQSLKHAWLKIRKGKGLDTHRAGRTIDGLDSAAKCVLTIFGQNDSRKWHQFVGDV